MSFESIKKNYDKGLWSKAMVRKAVEKGVITEEQYKEITGEKETETIEITDLIGNRYFGV